MHAKTRSLRSQVLTEAGMSMAIAMLAPSSPAMAQNAGHWELDHVESSKAEITGNPCYSHSYSGGAGSATHSQRLVCGNEPWSGSATGTWSMPPNRLNPGEKIEMSGSVRASAAHTGITAGINLEVSFNTARCGGTQNRIPFFLITAASHDPNRQSVQGRGTATVPGSGWGGGGNLTLRACMEGWQTYYVYRWRAGSGSGSSGSQDADESGHHNHGGSTGAISGDGTPAAAGWTFSRWTSITPDQRQFASQPGRTLPLRVFSSSGVEVQFFKPGEYVVFYAISDPQGRSISRWERAGPFTLYGGDKWKATSYGPMGLRMERNTADLIRYSTIGGGAAMIYARNDDVTHWRAICVLPVGSGMTVGTHCFRGSNVVRVSPDTAGNLNETPPGFKGPTVSVFNNGNDGAVGNGPTRPTIVNFTRPTLVTKLTTYHWNNGRGTPFAGTIALRSSSGGMYGPWRATGQPGSGGAPNAYWVVSINVELPAGTYTIVDSDPSTWAQNGQSGGAGLAWIDGKRQ